MGKIKRMDQVKNIIRTYKETQSIKGTAKRLKVSKNTVRDYVRRVKYHCKDFSEALALSEDQLYNLCYKTDTAKATLREQDFQSRMESWIEELKGIGVTRQRLWQEYCKKVEQPYGYSQFCERFSRELGRRDLTIVLEHVPGEKMQVDFAGKTMSWVDIETGEVHRCQILIATFPRTQHSFAIALESQKEEDFIHGLNEAFVFFGRLPKVVLSDNLKAFVTRADKYEPDFNALCVQLATHYQIDMEAARVRKPKDKASVENLVSTIYRRIYAPLRNEVFYSLVELNAAIRKQLIAHNNTPYQKKPGCRLSEFEKLEYPVMRDLPTDLFEIKKTTQSKVRRDYHIYIGEEKNYYSVPYQYVGCQATVVYTSKIVEVFVGQQRVAIHSRLYSRNSYRHQTQADHMPQNHQEWKKSRGYDAAYFIKQGSQIGEATHWAIEFIIRSAIHPPQSFNSCQGVLSLGRKYSNDRLEKACARCQKIDKVSYTLIKNILARNLDVEEEGTDLFTPPIHKNIRGPKYYR